MYTSANPRGFVKPALISVYYVGSLLAAIKYGIITGATGPGIVKR